MTKMNECKPINTVYGYLCGRDAIYLDEISCDYRNGSVRLTGQFNGNLFSRKIVDDFIDYVLDFTGIYILRMTELDLSYELVNSKFEDSSFFEIMNSELLDHAEKVRNIKLRHFILQTYDDVFEIVCKDYKLCIRDSLQQSSSMD
ncbi:MAG: hypothetical protein R2741_12805 [Methanolobus sp.]